MKKKLLALIVCAVLALTSLAACAVPAATSPAQPSAGGEKTEAETEAEAPADPDNPWAGLMDFSKPETITFCVVGQEPNDLGEVIDLINERLMSLINTKLEMNFISITDYATLYPLAIQDNTNDLIFTAEWSGYKNDALNGAFVELTEEFRDKYMPQTQKAWPESAWKQASINGVPNAVPRNYRDNNNFGAFMVRKDIEERIGISDIDSYEDFFDFLETTAAEIDPSEGYAFYMFPSVPIDGSILYPSNHWLEVNRLIWDTDEEIAEDCSNLKYPYMTDEYLEWALMLARFAKEGVWPSSAIQGTVHTGDLFKQGRSFSFQVRYQEAESEFKGIADLGKEVDYVCVLDDDAYVKLTNFSGDMTAITAFSKHPERAAVVLDILLNDPEINLLACGGIEGVHYVLDENGYRSNGEKSDDYPWNAWAWALRNSEIYPPDKLIDEVQVVKDEMDKHILPDERWPFDGFTTDDTKYEANIAVINSIINTYKDSFELGVFGDETADKVAQMQQELIDAGIEEVVAEWQRQAAEYMKQ